MRILLRPQCRTVNLTGRRTVSRLLRELGVVPGTAMVIRNDTLLLDSEIVEEEDEIEVRAVISGGAA
jgi:sulfur carrier protein ThiS